jgi:multiple sugar transport system permease protein
VFCSLAGFGFAYYRFRGKNVLFTLLVATLMVPPILFIIPYFSMMSSWHWIDAPRALYLPSIANAFGVLLMRKHIESAVPRDLYDAAKIDGCSDWNIYRRVVLPMIKPGLGILAILSFFTSWNSYFYPLVIMMSAESYTIPIALNRVSGSMLAASLSVLPLLIVFLIASRWIIEGFTEGALKDF